MPMNASHLPVWQSLASSMSAGAIACFLGCPFDVALIRMQADGMRPAAERRNYQGVGDALGRMVREEGVPALWRGFQPTVLRAVVATSSTLATYDQLRGRLTRLVGRGAEDGGPLFLRDAPQARSAAITFLCSAVSGLATTVVVLPFDIIKARLQSMKPVRVALQGAPASAGTAEAAGAQAISVCTPAAEAVAAASSISGSGGVVPASQFYSTASAAAPSAPATAAPHGAASSSAGAAEVRYVMRMPYSGPVDCARKILRAEGLLAFWTGFTPGLLRFAPNSMAILLGMEIFNSAFDWSVARAKKAGLGGENL